MMTATGKLMTTVAPHTMNVLPSAVHRRGLANATRQFPSPHSGGGRNMLGAMLNV